MKIEEIVRGWLPWLLILFLVFPGCTYGLKFTHKTAQKVKENTIIAMDTIQDYLIAWPLYSGAIDGLKDEIKGWLPQEFWDAKDLLDELSSHCPSLEDNGDCDFSKWDPTVVIPPTVYFEAKIILKGRGVTYYPRFGPQIIFKDVKKDEYVTGFAAGTAVVMAAPVIRKTLKELGKLIPEVGDLLKIIPRLII